MKRIIENVLRSDTLWRFTGLTYPTAVIATHGRYVSKAEYLIAGKNEMSVLFQYFDQSSTVIEFGTGPGKNLFSLAEKINFGYGIDINYLYLRLANKLKGYYGFSNISFIKYDGFNFPTIPKVDIVFEKGVFERLSKDRVKFYVEQLRRKYLKDNGFLILYFLMNRAMGTIFTKRLGDEAYVFWNQSEIKVFLDNAGLKINDTISLDFSDFYICTSK